MATTSEGTEASSELIVPDSQALAGLSKGLLSFAEVHRQMLGGLDVTAMSRTLLSVTETHRQLVDSLDLMAVSRTLLSSAEIHRQMMASLDMAGLTRTLLSVTEGQRQMLANLNSAYGAVSRSGLSQLMSMVEGLRTLDEDQLTTAAIAVEEAYRATPEDDVPEELIAELADTARDLTTLEAVEYLPVEISRRHLGLYVGAVFMTSLMTVTFSSETADGILGEFLELSGFVALLMVAAQKAHDRVTGASAKESSDENSEDSDAD
ncbi:hypothetical protein [Streptomyces sp. NPDC047123]|uniref:hypothetical protein n=1 Tax=Streptomyces sp. NPDC047123 TaxID=3155622 RepID=UPI0033E2DCBC